MAERRMFAKTITNSDAFLSMPASSQCLYLHLSINADDDGFNNNPRSIMRMCNASEDDLKVLIAKNFIIPFESGIIVIKHWRLNNYLRNDRHKETKYKEEFSRLNIKENGAYTLDKSVGIPLVDNWDTQYSIDKDSIEENSIDNIVEDKPKKKPIVYISHIKDLHYVKLPQDKYDKLKNDFPNIDLDKTIIDLEEYVASNGNKNKYKDWNLVLRRAIKGNWFNKQNTYNNSKRVVPVPDWYKEYEKKLEHNEKEKEEEYVSRYAQLLAKSVFNNEELTEEEKNELEQFEKEKNDL